MIQMEKKVLNVNDLVTKRGLNVYLDNLFDSYSCGMGSGYLVHRVYVFKSYILVH